MDYRENRWSEPKPGRGLRRVPENDEMKEKGNAKRQFCVSTPRESERRQGAGHRFDSGFKFGTDCRAVAWGRTTSV